MNEREKTLRKHFKQLKEYINVLSIRADQKKIVNNEETDIDVITFYVSKKVPERYRSGRRRLTVKDTIPKEIDGVPTDVVELSSPDFKLGKTPIGDMPPHVQRRVAGGVIR